MMAPGGGAIAGLGAFPPPDAVPGGGMGQYPAGFKEDTFAHSSWYASICAGSGPAGYFPNGHGPAVGVQDDDPSGT